MRQSSVSLVPESSVSHLPANSGLLDNRKMRDPLVVALERLIAREGGREKVADEIKSSEQTLYQIVKGAKDSKSGNPKGVGPSLRARLDASYPGWRSLSDGAVLAFKESAVEQVPGSKPQQHHPIGRGAYEDTTSPTPETKGVSIRNVTQFTPGFSASAFNATHRAPVVPWGRMGVDVLSRANAQDGELAAPVDFAEDAVVWRIDDDSMSPDYNPGDFIAIDSSPESLEMLAAGEAVIVETSGGTRILRYYTPMVDGHFEARPPMGSRYASLSTLQMQLQVRAVVQAHLRIRRQVTTR